MIDDKFGQALLTVIEQKANENNRQDYAAMMQLAGVVRRTLGMEEQKDCVPAPIPQLKVPGEYPHWRVKYSADGTELGG